MIGYETKVRQIATLVIGSQPKFQITFLGRGATSAAWRVETKTDSIVVRLMPAGTNRPMTYRSEFMLLNALKAKVKTIPVPLASSVDLRATGSPIAEPWAVTRTVSGTALKKRPLPTNVAYQLGALLAKLHTLPTTGHGRLHEQSDTLHGQHNAIITAALDRWRWGQCWPFDNSALKTHPYVQTVPESLTSLALAESEILHTANQNHTVINHSDLHGEHIFVQDGQLTGVIDFGAAFAGVPGWDFASISHNFGWQAAVDSAYGYTTSGAKRKELLKQSRLLALVVSMYKLSKASQEGVPTMKQTRIQNIITELLTLDRQAAFTNTVAV